MKKQPMNHEQYLRGLMIDLEWIYNFLQEYPPYYSDGKAMDEDISRWRESVEMTLIQDLEEMKMLNQEAKNLTPNDWSLIYSAVKLRAEACEESNDAYGKRWRRILNKINKTIF